jgi:hypothetical protein
MKSQPEREVIVKATECPNGHRINLHTLANTPNMIQRVKCPTCDAERIRLIGQLVSVTPADEGLVAECHERNLLLGIYEQRVRQYTQAVLNLKDKVRDIPQVELNLLWAATEQTRAACEKARELLKIHAAEHRC